MRPAATVSPLPAPSGCRRSVVTVPEMPGALQLPAGLASCDGRFRGSSPTRSAAVRRPIARAKTRAARENAAGHDAGGVRDLWCHVEPRAAAGAPFSCLVLEIAHEIARGRRDCSTSVVAPLAVRMCPGAQMRRPRYRAAQTRSPCTSETIRGVWATAAYLAAPALRTSAPSS